MNITRTAAKTAGKVAGVVTGKSKEEQPKAQPELIASPESSYDNDLIGGKLRRWEKYIMGYRMPSWDEIPDIGLYMEQVISLLKQYLDYLPPELKEEQFITASAINNYVRTKVMPEPVKKKYYRIHMAYLIMIFSLKQSLSLATLNNLIPMNIPVSQVKTIYNNFRERQQLITQHFRDDIRMVAGKILKHDEYSDIATNDTGDLVLYCAIVGSLCRVLAEKMLLLRGKTLQDGGSIEPYQKRDGTEIY